MGSGGTFSIESWRASLRGVLVWRLGEWHGVDVFRLEGLQDLDGSPFDAFLFVKGRRGAVGVLMGNLTGEEPSM